MIHKVFHFDFSQLKISVGQIEKVLGYSGDERSGIISGMISDVLNEASPLCSVTAEYTIFPEVLFNPSEKSIVVSDISFNINNIVYQQIKKSTSIAVFLCTAGHGIGSESKTAMKGGDLLKGYLLDIIGTEIVESATDLMQSELEKEVIKSGRKITNRYSPGYCSWNVAEQHKLFRLIPENTCGIRLNESSLMDPIKSVSGFIGIGENVKFNPYTCNFCDLKDCIYRSKRSKPLVSPPNPQEGLEQVGKNKSRLGDLGVKK